MSSEENSNLYLEEINKKLANFESDQRIFIKLLYISVVKSMPAIEFILGRDGYIFDIPLSFQMQVLKYIFFLHLSIYNMYMKFAWI